MIDDLWRVLVFAVGGPLWALYILVIVTVIKIILERWWMR